MCGVKDENNHCCKICNITGMTHLEFYDHTFTKEHEKKSDEEYLKSLFCNKCNIRCENSKALQRHKETKMHINGRMTKEDLFCEKCNLQCKFRKEFEIHCTTKKHFIPGSGACSQAK
jgi:hypothetical protein